MRACPDKNNVKWKELTDAVGHRNASKVYFRKGDGSIPTIEEAEQILNLKSEDIQTGAKKFSDWKEQEPYTKPNFIESAKKGITGLSESVKTNGIKAIQVAFPSAFQTKNYATLTKIILRKSLGEVRRVNAIADAAVKKTMSFWNSKDYNTRMHFIESMENPDKYIFIDEPELDNLRKQYKKRLDDVFDIISKIKDVPYFEDYFPHFWKNPESAKGFFSVLAKRPMEGNKSFLRQRFFQDVKAGIKAGYELATDNPEEMVRLAEINAIKFKMAHDVFYTFKRNNMLEFVKSGDPAPDGFELVDDSLFKRMAPYVTKEGEASIMSGGWYMPEDAARIVNNYLSKGLGGSKNVLVRGAFKSGTYLNALKNTFQLGFNAYHLTATSMDAIITTSANGLTKLTTGKPKLMAEGLIDIAKGFTVLPAIAENYARNKSVKGDYLGGRIPIDVQRLVDVNGNVTSEKQWTINSEYEFKKAIQKVKQGEGSQIPSAVWNGLMTIPEYASKPIMEHHVPAMKVGGFLKTVETELALNPNMTETEIQEMQQRVWDDMDDRLGQVVYDNLFWNKTLKDLAFMTVRSFGWTGGTIKAFGKGIADIPESAIRLTKGQGISTRTSWLITLPIQVGLYGAIYHYLNTGKKPETMEDYFFPKDGTKNPDGTDRRVNLPTYMKDIFAYSKGIKKELLKKTSPFINETYEVYSNKDFYGVPVYDEKDDFFGRGLDVLKYEFKSFEPFGFRKRPGEEDEPLLSKKSIESKTGLTQAPAEFTRTELENKVNDVLTKEAATYKRSKDYKPEQSVYKKIIQGQLKEGKTLQDIAPEQMQKAGLTTEKGEYKKPAALGKLASTKNLTIAQRNFNLLSTEGQLEVVSQLDDKTFNELIPDNKARRIFKINGIFNLKRISPEIFKDESYKKAFKRITGQDFSQE
jgi:hypothetical protein